MQEVLKLDNISKFYKQGDKKLEILNETSFSLYNKQKVAFVGPSGCGKSTFLQLCGLLDDASSGDIYIDNIKTTKISDKEKTNIRKDKIGFIYQFHHLFPEFSAIENVMIPLFINKVSNKEAFKEAEILLTKLGLKDRIHHRPAELSGGEQQRVAIARAIIKKPKIILADEPTGNLDPDSSNNVLDILIDLINEFNLTLLMVTHNINLTKKMDRIITIHDGKVVEK